MAIPHSVIEMIGNTPMLELTRFDTGPCRLFVKLENQNPGGSIKDRVALSMIEQAERDGKLQPGGTIIEATAGNTGLGLALVAALKGYKLLLVVPDKMSREKIFHLRALGVEVLLTRSDVGKASGLLSGLRQTPGRGDPRRLYIDQFNNPANPAAHTTTTAPELWRQMEHDVDAIVVGVGSGGTLGGLSRYFAEVSPQTELCWPTLPALSWRTTSTAATSAKRAAGWWKASAKTSSRRSATLTRSATLIASATPSLRHRARSAAQGRRAGGIVHRHPAGRRAALLPRTDRTQAGGDLCLR